MAARALIRFAHGARDARWREPFDRLRDRLAAQQPDIDTRLAFLELMTPDLPGTIADLAANGTQSITIVPVFFGQG
ncbi:CbiX/SirB N-terminal domain-containing protein, partial [Acinetobacter baumannii]